jgi:hypothetical protein
MAQGSATPKRLLSVADQHLPRSEAVQAPRQPNAKGAHVGAERQVGCHEPLQLRDQPERMNRPWIIFRARFATSSKLEQA